MTGTVRRRLTRRSGAWRKKGNGKCVVCSPGMTPACAAWRGSPGGKRRMLSARPWQRAPPARMEGPRGARDGGEEVSPE
ncbi:MAG TPA: hypothetical protein VNI57_04285, partial [Candidatus Saccharimonadales bacterium]|nr:hypothetical protein [Candidatus Saccharimonadales bacterium]